MKHIIDQIDENHSRIIKGFNRVYCIAFIRALATPHGTGYKHAELTAEVTAQLHIMTVDGIESIDHQTTDPDKVLARIIADTETVSTERLQAALIIKTGSSVGSKAECIMAALYKLKHDQMIDLGLH